MTVDQILIRGLATVFRLFVGVLSSVWWAGIGWIVRATSLSPG